MNHWTCLWDDTPSGDVYHACWKITNMERDCLFGGRGVGVNKLSEGEVAFLFSDPSKNLPKKDGMFGGGLPGLPLPLRTGNLYIFSL